MSEAATTAKRAEIAKTIREDAAKLDGSAKMLRLFESLCYEENNDARKAATAQLTTFASEISGLQTEQLGAKKGAVLEVVNALRYLVKFKFLPDDFAPKAQLDKVVSANGWDKKK
jgi:hypothetical protein